MDKKEKIIEIIDDFLESYKKTTIYLYDERLTSNAVNEADNLTTLFKMMWNQFFLKILVMKR